MSAGAAQRAAVSTLRRALLLAAGAAALPVRATSDARPALLQAVDPRTLPKPGSYRLPRISAAPDGTVLDIAGQPQRLHALLRGRSSVLSFIYTYCGDPLGCPRAWAVMDALHTALVADATLAASAQLLSLSFDPSNDTPEQMRLFAGARARDRRVRWHFLTTASVPALLPLLKGFGQDVSVETDAAGWPTRARYHVLRVFLVDAQLAVREIYSVATLAPEAVLVDLRTLRLERLRGDARG